MKQWQQQKEELREWFDSKDGFPKDKSATEGGAPSKSNRSAALLLWARWEILLREAIKQERREAFEVEFKEFERDFEFDVNNHIQGKCGFGTALCSAIEQDIKIIIHEKKEEIIKRLDEKI